MTTFEFFFNKGIRLEHPGCQANLVQGLWSQPNGVHSGHDRKEVSEKFKVMLCMESTEMFILS